MAKKIQLISRREFDFDNDNSSGTEVVMVKQLGMVDCAQATLFVRV